MDSISDTGSRNRTSQSVSAVLVAGLAAVACIHWLPVLSFFFSVPLFVVYFVRDRKVFVVSVLFAFVLDSTVSLVAAARGGNPVSLSTAASAVLGSGFFILPILFLASGSRLRLRYRIALAGVAATIAWALFFLLTDAGASLDSLLRELSASSAGMLYEMVPEGFERTAFMAQLAPEALYSILRDILLFSVLPICIMMYAAGFKIAAGMARLMRRGEGPVFAPVFFYNDFFVFYPLISGMCGIMAGKMADLRLLSVLSWNITLASGLFFFFQGFGILQFFIGLLQKKTRSRFFLVFLFLTLLMLLNGWMVFFGCLLVAGVVELFVPLRSRFDNKDGIDPTPGRDTDQHQ